MSGGRSGSNPWLVAVIVTLGAFMEVLDTTIVNVSLPHIAGSLSVSNDESTWSLTTYLVANGIVLTISGALSRRIGRKKYFLTCIAGFTVASLACGISNNFSELLLFRGLQGLFGGGLQPTQQAIILDVFPPEKRQQAFSLTAVATIIAPVLGPVLGGYLTDQYSWHWIFLVNIPIGALTFFGVLHTVQDAPGAEQERKSAPPIDYWGILFIALALGCMEIGIDRGEDYDWLNSGFVVTMFVLSACGYLFGIAYLLYAKNPIVNLRVFKDRNFALSWIEIALMGFVLYSSAVIIPQFAQSQLGYTATVAGLVLAPGAVVLVMLIPLTGQILKIVPVKYVIAAGGLALSAALLYSRNLIPQLDFTHLLLFRAAQTAALALLFVPHQHHCLHHRAEESERRCHRAVQHGAQRIRRRRHFGRHRVAGRSPANPPEYPDWQSYPVLSALQHPAGAGGAGAGECWRLRPAGHADGAGADFPYPAEPGGGAGL